MDAVLPPFPRDQTVAPNSQNRIKIPKKNRRCKRISNPSHYFDTYAGLLNPPTHPHAHSLSSSSSYQQNQQPPLLPLPTVSPMHHQPILSPSLGSRKKSTTRDMSLTLKESKPTKRDEDKKRATQSMSEFLIPKHLSPVVFTSSGNIGIFSGSAFNLSPPPSSLPVPKFCVRSKLSCNAETAGVDTGATDNLRRLLRLI